MNLSSSTNKQVCYAGFWRRSLAALVDTLVLLVIISIILGPRYTQSDFFSSEGLTTNLITILLTVILWLKFLGTPGKLLLGCQVVDANTHQAMSTKQAIIRYASYYISMLPLMFGFFIIAWDKRKQGFHDKIAKTVVLYDAELDYNDESQKSLNQLLSEVR